MLPDLPSALSDHGPCGPGSQKEGRLDWLANLRKLNCHDQSGWCDISSPLQRKTFFLMFAQTGTFFHFLSNSLPPYSIPVTVCMLCQTRPSLEKQKRRQLLVVLSSGCITKDHLPGGSWTRGIFSHSMEAASPRSGLRHG